VVNARIYCEPSECLTGCVDYSDPPDALSAESRRSHDIRAELVESIGEPWVCHFEPQELRTRLTELGFSEIEDLGPPQISERYFPARLTRPPETGGHILRASTIPA